MIDIASPSVAGFFLVIFAFGGALSLLALFATGGGAYHLFWKRVLSLLPQTDLEKASAERETNIEKRAVDFIREKGMNERDALYEAEKSYMADLQKATP